MKNTENGNKRASINTQNNNLSAFRC